LEMVLDRPELNERDTLLSIAQKLKDGERRPEDGKTNSGQIRR
jgi:hypothetical protein